MKFKTRYRFLHVFLVILGLGVLFEVIIPFLTDWMDSITNAISNPENGYRDLLGFLYYVVFFYFTLNFYYQLLAGNKTLISYIRVTAIVLIIVFLYHTILYYYLPWALLKKYTSLLHLFFVMSGNMIPMFLVSYLIVYVTVSREAVKQKRILEAQKLQLESTISQANFNFLKAQINPHFLHNTLNFLYAKSLPYSPELSEGILTLSDIMRYALSQGNQKDGKAFLKDEIEHVQNVISIHQLRYNNQLKVNFTISGEANEARIIPFVLITIVENAFKHGDLKDPEHPIDIRLEIKEDGVYFFCKNKKKPGPKQISTGIGLDNIKKRLELTYSEHQLFKVEEDVEFYITELTIDKL